MPWLVSLGAGLLVAPVGFALGTLLHYAWLAWRGMREDQGRRGLLAATIGGPLGAIGGFWLGFQTSWWLLEGGGSPWRGFVAGCLIGLPAAAIAGTIALVAGVKLAERRRVTNYAGERAAWALYYVALPTTFVVAASGFVLGWWLARQ